MANKTPVKLANDLNNSFSPVTLPVSPGSFTNRNLTGLPRVIRDIIADLYNNIQHWNDKHIFGAKIVKQIANLKANSAKMYPEGLEELSVQLYECVESLREDFGKLEQLIKQIEAVGKLHRGSSALFISMPIEKMIHSITMIVQAYEKELKIKEKVLDNICHSQDEEEAMFYALCWTYQVNITDNIKLKLEALLTEVGHRKFI